MPKIHLTDDTGHIREKKKSTYTEAKKEANKRWNAKTVQLSVRVSPELSKKAKAYCKKTGKSLTGLVTEALTEFLGKDEPSKDWIDNLLNT